MLNILSQRRSVRDFTTQSVTAEQLETLREAVLRAPTSRNRKPWQFIFVEQKELIEALAKSKSHGTRFLETAQLALVIVADPEVSDVWVEDCAIAAIVAQLAAESLGLKSCWGQLRLRAHDDQSSASSYVCRLLDIPAGLEVPIIIGFGYPAEIPQGHEPESLPWDKLHRNRFSQ
jgi:nitroreductase